MCGTAHAPLQVQRGKKQVNLLALLTLLILICVFIIVIVASLALTACTAAFRPQAREAACAAATSTLILAIIAAVDTAKVPLVIMMVIIACLALPPVIAAPEAGRHSGTGILAVWQRQRREACLGDEEIRLLALACPHSSLDQIDEVFCHGRCKRIDEGRPEEVLPCEGHDGSILWRRSNGSSCAAFQRRSAAASRQASTLPISWRRTTWSSRCRLRQAQQRRLRLIDDRQRQEIKRWGPM